MILICIYDSDQLFNERNQVFSIHVHLYLSCLNRFHYPQSGS